MRVECSIIYHLCLADDLYAMAGTMNHLTHILEDKTNAVERLGMRWKEKSLTIVAGPFTEYKPGELLRLSAMVAYVGFGVWWNVWRHWERGWTIGDGSEATRRRLCSAIPTCQ